MKWEQIELQWAAMTRRVQCDWAASPDTDLNRPDEVISARSDPASPDARPLGTTRPAARCPESGASRAD
jgi:hypothetical protein